MTAQDFKNRGWVGVALFALGCLLSPDVAAAQRLTYSEGQAVIPAFEGWELNEDGSYNLLFGYMNENWENEPNIPIGPENAFSPGPVDRGQPTHFLPRRNRYMFKVQVPADFGGKELVWTLRANGKEYKAYGSLRADYATTSVVIMSETGALGAGSSSPEIRANNPPAITVEGPRHLKARVGEPLVLAAKVTDDGEPPPEGFSRDSIPAGDPLTSLEMLELAMDQTGGVTVNKAVGLYFTWFVYRGAGEVTFDPPQIEPWEDTRTYANSPWASHWMPPGLRRPSELPEDGRWTSEITFHEPGTYVLRGRADDGGLFSDVEVRVEVTR